MKIERNSNLFIVPVLIQRNPSKIARVIFYARTKSRGGFGGPGGGFSVLVAVVAWISAGTIENTLIGDLWVQLKHIWKTYWGFLRRLARLSSSGHFLILLGWDKKKKKTNNTKKQQTIKRGKTKRKTDKKLGGQNKTKKKKTQQKQKTDSLRIRDTSGHP